MNIFTPLLVKMVSKRQFGLHLFARISDAFFPGKVDGS